MGVRHPRVKQTFLKTLFRENTIIRDTFLPYIFFIKKKPLSLIVGAQITMMIEKYRLGIINSVTSEKERYLSFHQASTELIRDVTGGAFSNNDHLLALREERRERAW